MNTKLLKQKILDLAIRGKLTQQLKSDGTAADLLKEIPSACHPERSAKGAKSKDLKQIIPLDKSEAPFEIPANWEWVRLGDVAKKITDGTHHSPVNLETGDFMYVTAKNIKDDGIHLENITYVSSDTHKEIFARCNPEKGDVLLIKDGATTGVVTVNNLEEPFSLLSSVALLKLGSSIESWYLAFVIRSTLFNQMIRSQMKGVGITRVTLKQIESFAFPLPPLAEQQRIVAKIEEAFAEIDAIEKNKELLKTHIKQTRQKILDLAIHGKLVPQNKSDEPACVLLERITRDNPHYEKIKDEPFEIPENWAWCRLGNLSKSIQYGYNAPAKDSGRIKMVRISDIHENEVEWDSVPYCDIDDKEIQTYLLKKNDILFARTGGTVGKSFIVSNLPEDAVYAGYLIRTRYGKNANAQYMKYFMESNLYWEQLRDGCIATAQPNCNGKTLGKMQIPLPPLAEQSRIVAKIEELFSTLDQMERNLV